MSKDNDKTVDEITEVEFFGKELTITQITNPHIRRVISEGVRPGYNDWSRFSCHTESPSRYREKYTQYIDWSQYVDYNNYS